MEKAYRNTGFALLALLPCVVLGFYKTYFGTFSRLVPNPVAFRVAVVFPSLAT